MSYTGSLKRLKDFEWASVTQYIIYISSVAGLKEVNPRHVVSFPLGRLGPDKLLKQKRRVLLLLEGNKACVERFAGSCESELDENEMAVLRSIYLQYRSSIETVSRHIFLLTTCLTGTQLSILQSEEEAQDDLLF